MTFVPLVLLLQVLVPEKPGTQEVVPLPEGNSFVRSAVSGPKPQDAAINDYTYDLLETRENLDQYGKATSRETKAYQVYFVKTRPVRRLVSRNGVLLTRKEQAEVDRKAEDLAKAIAEGRTVNELPGIRLSSLLDSFQFTTLLRESREGRPTLVFGFEPRKGAVRKPSDRASDRASDAITRILIGRLHIDEADRRVALLDARNTPGQKAGVATGVKLGAFELTMEFAAVEPGVWLPRNVVTLATGRAFFFRTFRVRQTTTYSNYRKFKIDTEERPVR